MSRPAAVGIVSTGVANTASVVAAFRRLHVESELVDDWRKVEFCPSLVLPGVGSFGRAMDRLRQLKMVEPLRERILAEKPTLAICLGLQLLCESSEESPDVEGLSVLPSRVVRFNFQKTGESGRGEAPPPAADLRVPHLGWNQVSANTCAMITDGQAYFAHSYFVDQVPDGWSVATADYGKPFVAALEKGRVVACQFHPELSGAWGRNLLSGWMGRVGVPAC